MAKFSLEIGDWVEDNIRNFDEADRRAVNFAKAAVYEGSKEMADAIAAAARQHGNLANGLRIATMRTDADGADTLIWFDGYDTDGVAFAVKANALESGRSTPSGGITGKHPFFRSAVNKAKKASKEAMHKKFLELRDEILER